MMDLGGIVDIPAGVRAALFDVDGVLLDTVAADHDLAAAAAAEIWGEGTWITWESVRAHFALEAESFWAELVKQAPFDPEPRDVEAAITAYQRGRATAAFRPIPGALALLDACRAAGLACAVASSNDKPVLDAMLERSGLAGRFDAISGIEGSVRAKPAPDIYTNAAAALGVDSENCVFIEDSVTGLTAGRAAGLGYAIAVATGATPVAPLRQSKLADVVFDRLAAPQLALFDGEPARKIIDTPNDFVSHMIEHIAWRLGVGVELRWRIADWRRLGRWFGEALRPLGFRQDSAATLGMIDDGAAETLIDFGRPASVDFGCHHSLSGEAVLAMRVEQVERGDELVELLEGLAEGIGAHVTVRLCTFEDPHHSWEGVFRSIGIGLARLRAQVAA